MGKALKNRIDGEEQPYISMGLFKIRLPIIHFGIETPEIVQGLIMFVTGVAATEYLINLFGISWEVAMSIVVIHELLYISHQIFGDPIIGGWLTGALPITLMFFSGIAEGLPRIHTLIALQIQLGILFLVFGGTGMAKTVIDKTPISIKAGIIMGSGMAAVIGQYGFQSVEAGGQGFMMYPYSLTFGILVTLYALYSKGFQKKIKGEKLSVVLLMVARGGLVPGFIISAIVGFISGEIPLPVVEEFGIFLPRMSMIFSEMTMFGVGIPPLSAFLRAIPMALIAYVVAFGDIIVGESIVEAANAERLDEKIDMDTNRTNVLCGLRNLIQAFIAPTVSLSGPLWAAMTVAVTERYKQGRNAMDSIFSGAGTFNIFKFIACLITPLLALVQPILPLALAVTIMVQGFACFYIALEMVSNRVQRGIAGISGAILAIQGPAYGLASAIILYFVIEHIFGEGLSDSQSAKEMYQKDEEKTS